MPEGGQVSVQALPGQPAFVDFRKQPMCGDGNHRRNVMGRPVPVSPRLQGTGNSGTPVAPAVTA